MLIFEFFFTKLTSCDSAANQFNYFVANLAALQISIAFFKSKLGSRNNLSFRLLSRMPNSILSLIKLSVRVENSHVELSLLNSLTYSSIASLADISLVKNTFLSYVIFFVGIKYEFNFLLFFCMNWLGSYI